MTDRQDRASGETRRLMCQATRLRWHKGTRCPAAARYRIVHGAFGGEILVCGNHARSWIPAARVPIGPGVYVARGEA